MSRPTQHSTLGASGASRWIACPGSILQSVGIEDQTSPYAEEGTQAHAYSEALIADGTYKPGDVARFMLEGAPPDDMYDHVKIYVDLIKTFIAASDWYQLESMFSLDELDPPVPAYGTADFVGYIAERQELIVADLKYGTGVVVEVEDNWQLIYYAIGAMLTFLRTMQGADVKRVRLIIVQPRAFHEDGKIREATLDVTTLVEKSIELVDAMHATQAPDAPLVPGTHCRFCKAAATCPALFDYNQNIAQSEFSVTEPGAKIKALNPDALSNQEIGHLMGKLDSIEHWIAAVRQYAVNEIERGRDVPGWKLVAKQARRRWLDGSEIDLVKHLLDQGLDREQAYAPLTLKSPAQMEKLGAGNLDLSAFYEKHSSGTKLARGSSSLPAVTAGSEFFTDAG